MFVLTGSILDDIEILKILSKGVKKLWMKPMDMNDVVAGVKQFVLVKK